MNHASIAGIKTAIQGLILGGLYALLDAFALSQTLETEVLVITTPIALGVVAYVLNAVEKRFPALTKIVSLGLAEQAASYAEPPKPKTTRKR